MVSQSQEKGENGVWDEFRVLMVNHFLVRVKKMNEWHVSDKTKTWAPILSFGWAWEECNG
jgi:hypothetical protein